MTTDDAPGLTVGSVFSGLEAFGLGLAQAGMRLLWQIENEPACIRVLERHWPDVRRYGDVREVRGEELQPAELVCGGSPCTDLSVAGKRAGLAGEQSGLFFDFVRIVDTVAPRWVLFENVDGLLSSHKGEDFATVLECLTGFRPRVPAGGWRNSGFCWGSKRSACWRVFDAEYDGLAQRRNRVFLVASARNRTDPVQVLLEPESCSWHPSPSREARPDIAASITSGSARPGIQRPGRRREDDVNLVAFKYTNGDDVHPNGPAYTIDQSAGRGGACVAYQCQGSNVGPMGTIRSGNGHVTGGVPFLTTARTSHHGRLDPSGETLIAHTISSEGADASEDGTGRGVPLVPLYYSHDYNQDRVYSPDGVAPAHTANDSNQSRNVAVGMAVRRLTPREIERLFGIPDDYTAYDANGKRISDSARYRMLGNSLAVPTVAWIAKRIVAIDTEATPCPS